MSQYTVEVGSHSEPCTVSTMRKKLAQALAILDGGAEVTFAFSATIKEYSPNPAFKTLQIGELAAPQND